MSLKQWSGRFVEWNRQLCGRIERLLPAQFTSHSHAAYRAVVAEHVNRRPDQTIVDVGGGKELPYRKVIATAPGQTIISLDILEDELRLNRDVELRVAADVVLSLPFEPESVDILTSRSVMEHLSDTDRYIKNCRSILRPNGLVIHSFPCRFAPFAVINQLLPNWLARKILYAVHPGWEDECGFKAYYSNCYPSAIERILEQNGFEVIHKELRYYQAIYFNFFVPFYLISVIYDLTVSTLGIRNLACQMLFVARRRPTEAA